MSNIPYLENLTLRLTEALSRWPESVRAAHGARLQRVQNADGGFSGRQGGSDLYYTGFALRGLAILDALTPAICERAAGYLRGCLRQQASVVDFFSFLYSCLLVQLGGGPNVLVGSPDDWPQRVTATLETFRTDDGGYGKAVGSVSGSTYHTFLVALCYELLGQPLPRPEAVAAFVHSRRRDDGGFVEIPPMRRSGTNPTAAAVGTLQILACGLSADVREGVIAFLGEMACDEGGLRANGRIPFADLLSTFTGCWTLAQLEAWDRLDHADLRAYVRSLEQPDGGFLGHLADDAVDVEYTFYGLGMLALLA